MRFETFVISSHHQPEERNRPVPLRLKGRFAPADFMMLALPLPLLIAAPLGVLLLLCLWWLRDRSIRAQREALAGFRALSEEIIAANTTREIAECLSATLPKVTRATSTSLYLFNRRTKSLERVPTAAEPEPMAASVDNPPEGLANAAAVSFRNRTLLSIPDVRRNPIIRGGIGINLPRSAMFVPLISKPDGGAPEVAGILEIQNSRKVGYFSADEQAAVQHLANQIAASLRLQEQRAMREQLFRSEKLAATGQLISGVATELRTPLEAITQISAALSESNMRTIPEGALERLSTEAGRANEIVSRLVSFSGTSEPELQQVDVFEIMEHLIAFREQEWRESNLRVQHKLGPGKAIVLGSRGQLEQVLLNVLVHAGQRAAQAETKAICIHSSILGGRLVIEIEYTTPASEGDQLDPFEDERGEDPRGFGVCQGIAHGHGGNIRVLRRAGHATFELELPLATPPQETPVHTAASEHARPLTLMIVEPDAVAQRHVVDLLAERGHRAVPVGAEQAADLIHRMRFDAVLWAVRSGAGRWSEVRERAAAQMQAFVLISDGYDRELARSLEESGGFLLARPIEEVELDRILSGIALRPVEDRV